MVTAIPTVGQNTVDINSALASGGLSTSDNLQGTNATTALAPGQYNNAVSTKPTSVVSTAPAISQVNQAKQVIDSQQVPKPSPTNDVRDDNGLLMNAPGALYDRNTGKLLNPDTKKEDKKTTEDKIMEQPDTGMQHVYDVRTGEQSEIPIGPIPSGFSNLNPTTRADATATADMGGGIVVKQFPDGSYRQFNVSTGESHPVTAADFNNAQTLATVTQQKNDLINKGILSPEQQSQVDAITSALRDAVDKQQIENANATGGMTIAQNLYGTFNTTFGAGAIQKTVTDGITAITKLQNAAAAAIAKLKAGFLTDDTNAVQDAWNVYKSATAETQKQLDRTLDNIQKDKDKADSDLQNYIFKSSNLHPDAGIDGTEKSIAEINKKIVESQTFKEKQTVVDTTPIDGNAPNPDIANIPSSATGKTPDALWKDANDYNLSGKTVQSYLGGLSSATQGTAYKNAIANKSAAILKAAGISSVSTLQQEFKANSLALNQLTKFMNTVDLNVTKAEDGVKQVIGAFGNSGINTFDATAVNKTLNELSKHLGNSSDIRAYQAGIFEVANDYAQVFTRGGQRNEAADKRSQDILSGNITLKDFQAVTDELAAQGKIVVKDSIDQMKKVANGGVDEVVKYLNYINSAEPSTASSTGTSSTSVGTSGASAGGFAEVW